MIAKGSYSVLGEPARRFVAKPLIVAVFVQALLGCCYGLKAVAGDPSGAASQFTLVDETLCDAFCHESPLRGRIQLTIAGKAYAGELEHACHEDHDHAGHEDHDVDETNAADGHHHDREPRTARREAR